MQLHLGVGEAEGRVELRVRLAPLSGGFQAHFPRKEVPQPQSVDVVVIGVQDVVVIEPAEPEEPADFPAFSPPPAKAGPVARSMTATSAQISLRMELPFLL